MKKTFLPIMFLIALSLFAVPVFAEASARARYRHDGTHDWFNYVTGSPEEGYAWLDIVQTSIIRYGDSLILSMKVRGKIPEYHPDEIDAALWWGFDTDKNPNTGWQHEFMNYGYFGEDYGVQVKYFSVDMEWRAILHIINEDGITIGTIELDDFSIRGNGVTAILPLELLGWDTSFYWRSNTFDYKEPEPRVDLAPDDIPYEFARAASPLENSLARKYHKINLLAEYPDPTTLIEFDESEATFIMHGWTAESWSEMTPDQKKEFFKTADFTLTIDGVTVDLRKYQWYNHAEDQMLVTYWTKFPPYTFTEGNTYSYEGGWFREIDGIEDVHSESGIIVPYS